MPELLEVELYRRQAEAVVGRTVAEVDAPDAWFVKGSPPEEVIAAVTGRTVTAARRRGKLLVLDLDSGGDGDSGEDGDGDDDDDGIRLGLRFGMTGRLIVDGAAAIDRLEYSSDRDDPGWDRFALRFTDGSELRIRDPRRLGGVSLDPDEDHLGPDALGLSAADLDAALGTSAAPLKARLLDQARVAGIGNLLADEVLWRAGLDPARPAGGLDPDERRRLLRSIAEVLGDLDERGGSHTGDLRQAASLDGRCPRDGEALVRRTIGGRTTWSCPAHQH